MTPQAKKVIELAVDEARRLNHHYIGTEHLLLGLVREGEGMAADVLANLGVSLEQVRIEVIQALNSAGSPSRRSDPPPLDPIEAPTGRAEAGRTGGKFAKFTERARKVLTLANEEAQRFNHNYIGTEHILLGLLREGDGVAARVLVNLGIELYKVRSAVEFIIGRGDRMVIGEMGLTPRAKKVIELAVDEARRLKHNYIGTEHLLLGLVREGEGIAAGVLVSLGVSLEKVRTEVIHVLNSGIYPPPAPPSRRADPSALAAPDDRSAPFERLTPASRLILTAAAAEAEHLQQHVGPEHLLLALIGGDDNRAALLLRHLGYDLAALRQTVESAIGPHPTRPPDIAVTWTPRALDTLLSADTEALWLGRPAIDPEHLLLGLVREGENGAARVLAQQLGGLKPLYIALLQGLDTQEEPEAGG